MRASALACLLALAACSGPGTPTNESKEDLAALQNAAGSEPENAVVEGNATAPLSPPAPREPGGLADDRTPLSEAPFPETSAQGAANVLQTYFALVEQGRYGDAWRLWSDGGRSSGKSADAFAAQFGEYREYHANIGAPGRIEGAAGSLYIDVPVQVYGRRADGKPFSMAGSATLRRANDVPGSTAEQRKWRIASIELKSQPQ